MDVEKNFTIEKKEYEHILEEHNTCCLCGAELKFVHKIDYLQLSVREDAQCPSCRVQLRVKEFTLQ